MAVFTVLTLLFGLIAAGPAPAATPCTSPPQILPIGQLTTGMTGTGYTTIQGSTPTPFTVEVLGVLDDYIWLDIPVIVIRITGPSSFLDRTGGVFYGMSGSPVYVGGKLIGAVSYGVSWDPTLVGLTPAAAMLGMLGHGGTTASLPERIPFDEQTKMSIAEALEVSAQNVTGGLQVLPSVLGVSGLSAARISQLQRMLDERGSPFQVVASSSMRANLPVNPAPFTAGQPIGSVLSWGDFTVWAAGTVAIACGDEVVAYGHSLFWNPPGDLTIGMTGVNVLTVGSGGGVFFGDMVPRLTEPRGAFLQDRFVGQAGMVGAPVPTAPITSSVASLDTGTTRSGTTEAIFPQDWWLQYMVWAHHVLNFGAVQGGLGPGTSELEWTIEGTRGDGTPFTTSNRGMLWSPYDATESVWKLISAVDQLTFNPFETVTIESLDTTGTITGDKLIGTITRVRSSSSLQKGLKERYVLRAKPGDRITVEVTLAPAGGGSKVVSTMTLKVPRHGSGGTVKIRGGKDRYWYSDAGSFEELLYNLSSGEHENDLITRAFGRTLTTRQSVIVEGRASFRVQIVR